MDKFTMIRELIEQYNSIIIYRHVNSDYDAYGSQLGMKYLIQENYPEKSVYCVGDEDIVNPQLLDPMDEPDEETIRKSLAVIVDCSTGDRISRESWKQTACSLRIDHHPLTYAICDHELIDTDASSACQLVAETAIHNGWKISKKAGAILFAGMSTDTVKFTIDKIDSRLYYDLAEIKKSGFNVNEINRKVYDIDRELFEIQNSVRSNIKFTKNLAYLYISLQDMKQWNLDLRDAKDCINLMSNIRGVDKYLMFIENDDHTYSVSLRSHKITISDIAVRYGGGGHLLASGVSSVTYQQTEEIIQQMADKE